MTYETGGPYNSSTILDGGSGQRAGLIGEMAFAEALAEHRITYQHLGGEAQHHDFLVNGHKIDVKAKQRNVEPSYDYDAHVTSSIKDKDCRLYVFASVTDGKPTLMGWMGKEEFWAEAKEVKEGELDESGKAERADAGKLKYSMLRPMERLWPLLGGGYGLES
jgi:hypothetical protein